MKHCRVAVEKSKTATNPNCHLRPRFILRDAWVADEKHVGVVPVPGASKGRKNGAPVAPVVNDARKGPAVALDVVPVAPQIAAIYSTSGAGAGGGEEGRAVGEGYGAATEGAKPNTEEVVRVTVVEGSQ